MADTLDVIINSIIRSSNSALRATCSTPIRYKAVYKPAGSSDGFKGSELAMHNVEPALKQSTKHIRAIIKSMGVLDDNIASVKNELRHMLSPEDYTKILSKF